MTIPDQLHRGDPRRSVLFTNGGIWTAHTRPLWATSLLLQGARIEAVGFEEVVRLAPGDTVVVDLDGRMVMPSDPVSPNRPSPSLLPAAQATFLGGHVPSLDRALALVTIERAQAEGTDGQTGSLEPGKLANLMVLDQNLFSIPPERVGTVRVQAILLEGRCVYDADTDIGGSDNDPVRHVGDVGFPWLAPVEADQGLR